MTIPNLPKENQILMIVNCARSWQEVENEKVYICPSQGSAYSHRPSRYFGVYHNRKVSHLANIEAVIDVQADGTTSFRWTALSFKETEDRQKALEYANRLRPKNEFPIQVFILGPLQITDFRKDSPGGMFGSVKYLDVSHLGVDTAGYLAQKLNGKTWSQIESEKEQLKTYDAQNDTASSSGKYTPLQNWLLAHPQQKPDLQLTFQKIEEIIGEELPPSAREYSAWWLDKSSDTTHTQALAWLQAGWEIESVDLKAEKVTFRL